MAAGADTARLEAMAVNAVIGMVTDIPLYMIPREDDPAEDDEPLLTIPPFIPPPTLCINPLLVANKPFWYDGMDAEGI